MPAIAIHQRTELQLTHRHRWQASAYSGSSSLRTPLWELSSFSEAAKAVGQATTLLTVPPLSQASQLQQLSEYTR